MTARRTRYQAKKELSLKEQCESLYLSVCNRNKAEATDFLKAGAKPDYIYLEDNMGFTPFHAAIPRYDSNTSEEQESLIHIELLDLLISNKNTNTPPPEKLNIFSEDVFGYNPFEWAIADGKNKCVRWFLKLLSKPSFKSIAKSIINRQNKLESTSKNDKKCKRIKNQTPIHIAVKSENIEIIKQLTKFTPRPKVGLCDNNNMNAIHLAIERNLPFILYELVNIATIHDLNVKNNSNQTALEYSVNIYNQSLKQAIKPSNILKSWQCKEIIKCRINHTLADKWGNIQQQKQPTHNSEMIFWEFTKPKIKNPNTNINSLQMFKPINNNIIHKDIQNIWNINNNSQINKYKLVSFKEACTLQHLNPKWITNYYGKLNVNQRRQNIQRLSPFAQNLKRLFIQQRKQLNFTYAPSKDKNSPKNGKIIKKKCDRGSGKLSESIFLYNNEYIEVEAINKDLDKELTAEDRIKFYEMSIGKYNSDNIELREILDVTHPCKRYNSGACFGLFAKANIPKKTIILEYTGLVCSMNEYEASLGLGGVERFDAQWRTFAFDTFKPKNECDRLLLDAAYYSNESVFVNDATYDDIFEKWSVHNVSFFEIRINGWPHAFLRAYNDIEKGEELLTRYGNDFWKNYKVDCRTSDGLNGYYMHRLRRNKEVMAAVETNDRKRKRECDREEMKMDMQEPCNKKRKIDAAPAPAPVPVPVPVTGLGKELESIDGKLDALIDGMNGNNNDGGYDESLRGFVGQMGNVYKLWKNSELKHNEYTEKQEDMCRNMERKYKAKMEEMNRKLDEKNRANEVLKNEVDVWRNNDKK